MLNLDSTPRCALRALIACVSLGWCACASTSGGSDQPADRRPSAPEPTLSPVVAMKKAQSAAREGDLDTAERYARLAAESAPDTEEAYLLWASCCEQRGDLACAKEAYDAGLEANPASPSLLRESGLLALQAGDVETAVQRFEASLSREDSPQTKSDLAFAYLFQDRPDDADALTEEVVREAPGCFTCWMARGEVLTRLGRHEDAVDAYQRAAGLEPGDLDAKAGLAKASYRAGDAGASLALFEELVESAPDDLRLRVQAAQVAMAAGQPARAVEHLQVVASALPEDPGVLNALLEAQRAAGDDESADATQAALEALRAGD